jgi:hypothetical protein
MFDDMASGVGSAAGDGAFAGLAPIKSDGSAADFGLTQSRACVRRTQFIAPFGASASPRPMNLAAQSKSTQSKSMSRPYAKDQSQNFATFYKDSSCTCDADLTIVAIFRNYSSPSWLPK